MAPNPRARARGRSADDGAGGAARARGWCATAPPVQTTALRGLNGIARFAERKAVESDGHARSTCGVRELRQPPVRRSVRQRAAAARRPTSIVCWWRSFVGGERAMLAAPRFGAARRRRRALGDDGPPRGSVRPTRHSTTLAATRRHPCRPEMVAADCAWFRSRPESVVAPDGTERSAEKGRRKPQWRRILARAREGAALMMALAARRELGGGVRQHPRFKQLR